jgi:hypothetical protein
MNDDEVMLGAECAVSCEDSVTSLLEESRKRFVHAIQVAINEVDFLKHLAQTELARLRENADSSPRTVQVMVLASQAADVGQIRLQEGAFWAHTTVGRLAEGGVK